MSAVKLNPEFRALFTEAQIATLEEEISKATVAAMKNIIMAADKKEVVAEKKPIIKIVVPPRRAPKNQIRQRISRAIPDGCTAERTLTGVEFRNGNQVLQKWDPAILKAVIKPRPEKGERASRAEITIFPSTVETGFTHSVSEKPAPKPEPVAAPIPSPTNGLLSAPEVMAAVWPDPSSRPSMRWFREMQARRAIPHIKIGRLTFFEADRVRASLRRFEVSAK